MKRRAVAAVAMFGVACTTPVPSHLVSWTERAPTAAPADSGKDAAEVGRLVVETDRDETQIGSKYYYAVRRPYDLYAEDGRLLRHVVNQGWRQGEEPETIALSPGRYVVATVYGTRYRKMQVEIRSGSVTDVTEDALRDAPAVFAKRP